MPAYLATVQQAEDGTWSGYVPDLAVILSVGNTPQELGQPLREAIAIWIEEQTSDGHAIPPPSAQAMLIEVDA